MQIKLLISETGDVESTEIVSGNPILAKAAADAMKNWKFKPYIKGGRAVKVRATLPFDFAFRNKVTDERSKSAPQPGPAQLSGSDSSNLADEDPNRPKKLRIAQGVMEGHMVHRVEPVYPPDARLRHITGTVILQATIGTDGRIHNLKAISGPTELVEASIGAVEQWRYRPYLLEGKPVEVETTVKIQFHM